MNTVAAEYQHYEVRGVEYEGYIYICKCLNVFLGSLAAALTTSS